MELAKKLRKNLCVHLPTSVLSESGLKGSSREGHLSKSSPGYIVAFNYNVWQNSVKALSAGFEAFFAY